ncbi:MAG: C10 family peptidase [Candidatus Spyradenecus sp.]
MSWLAALACFGLLGPKTAGAREVTEAEAQASARVWLARNGAMAGASSAVAGCEAVRSAAGQLLYYKVAFAGGGLLIVAPDTRLEPVVASVPQAVGADFPEGHPLPAILAADMAQRLAALAAYEADVASVAAGMKSAAVVPEEGLGDYVARAEGRWAELLAAAEASPRLKSANGSTSVAKVFAFPEQWANAQWRHWNQTYWNTFYNGGSNTTLYDRDTPNNYPAGCVPVAGVALLQAFNVTQGPGVMSATYYVNGTSKTDKTSGYSSFDWSILPEWKSGMAAALLTDEVRDLLAKPVADMGKLIGAMYASGGTGAYLFELRDGLVAHYGFQRATYVYPYSYSSSGATNLTASDIERYIHAQLRCGAPVILGIIDPTAASGHGAGHCVNAVGYGEDESGTKYAFISLGWGASDDAWYALPAIGTPNYDFSIIDEVVTGLATDARSGPVYGTVTCEGEAVSGAPVYVYSSSGELLALTATGAYGQFGVRVPTPNSGITVYCGTTKAGQTLRLAQSNPSETFYTTANDTDTLSATDLTVDAAPALTPSSATLALGEAVSLVDPNRSNRALVVPNATLRFLSAEGTALESSVDAAGVASVVPERKMGEQQIAVAIDQEFLTVESAFTVTVDRLGEAYGGVTCAWLREAGLLDKADADLTPEEVIAAAESDGDGDGYAAWQEFVAGSNPTDAASVLRITAIEVAADGTPTITFEPALEERTYTLYGSATLGDAALWETPLKATHRFFKVRVER